MALKRIGKFFQKIFYDYMFILMEYFLSKYSKGFIVNN